MKVRVTLLTENNEERTPEITEAKVLQAWQLLLAYVCAAADNGDSAKVEKVEFVEDE